MEEHAHHWVLAMGTPAEGICACGARREFSGGFSQHEFYKRAAVGTLAPRNWHFKGRDEAPENNVDEALSMPVEREGAR